MTAWPMNPTDLRGLLALGILAALLGFAFGCGIEEPQPKPQAVVQPYAERDSAGIRLVENTLPVWEPGGGWQIHPEPVLELGTVDGEEPYVFTQLAQAGKLSDGRLFVVDRRTHQIRTFDREGRHVRTFGQPGDGPGQFGASPVVTVVPGDTLLTFDAGVPGTLSTPDFAWFLPDGSLLRSAPFATLDPADARDLRDLGGGRHLIPDGTLVVLVHRRIPARLERDAAGNLVAMGPSPGEVQNREYRLLILSERDPGRVEIEGDHPALQLVQRESGMEPNPAYPRVSMAAEGPPVRVHVSHPDQWEVRTYDDAGALTRIVRLSAPREPADMPGLAPPMTIPDSVPPIHSVFTDTEGNLWLQERIQGTHRGGFQVVDRSGRWLGRVERPEALGYVFEIGRDYVLTLAVDDLGVHYLVEYRLNREP